MKTEFPFKRSCGIPLCTFTTSSLSSHDWSCCFYWYILAFVNNGEINSSAAISWTCGFQFVWVYSDVELLDLECQFKKKFPYTTCAPRERERKRAHASTLPSEAWLCHNPFPSISLSQQDFMHPYACAMKIPPCFLNHWGWNPTVVGHVASGFLGTALNCCTMGPALDYLWVIQVEKFSRQMNWVYSSDDKPRSRNTLPSCQSRNVTWNHRVGKTTPGKCIEGLNRTIRSISFKEWQRKNPQKDTARIVERTLGQ